MADTAHSGQARKVYHRSNAEKAMREESEEAWRSVWTPELSWQRIFSSASETGTQAAEAVESRGVGILRGRCGGDVRLEE